MIFRATLAGLLALLATVSAAAPLYAIVPATPDLEQAEKVILQSTNAFRAEHGRPDLARDKTLAATAKRFADYMARTSQYGHEADGRTAGERLRAQGYSYCMVAENIAYAFDTRGFRTPELASRIIEGWKASPGHRRNLLDSEARVMGMAIARSPKTGYYYAVQMFARPMKSGRC